MPPLQFSSGFATDFSASGAVSAVDNGAALRGGASCKDDEGRGGAVNVGGSIFPRSF
jgi:hypothetical protein